jgi:hypothetical protein
MLKDTTESSAALSGTIEQNKNLSDLIVNMVELKTFETFNEDITVKQLISLLRILGCSCSSR